MTPIEIMARALYDGLEGPVANQDFGRQVKQWNFVQEIVQTAFCALQSNGYAIVPIEPTFDMKMAGASAITEGHMRAMANYDAACDCWPAMVTAALAQKDR